MARLACAIGLVLATIALTATAQVPAGNWGQYGGGGAPFAYYAPQASTAGQAAAMGMSDVIRSAGAANLMNSQAAINVEQARSQNIDNRLQWTNTYFEMRRVNRAYRQAEKVPGLSMADASRIAKQNAPQRLASSQLDPLTGQINWPIPLRDPRYAEYQTQLEQLFSERAVKGGSIGADTYQQIRSVCKDFMAAIQKNVRDFAPTDFAGAFRFVQSLQNEAGFTS